MNCAMSSTIDLPHRAWIALAAGIAVLGLAGCQGKQPPAATEAPAAAQQETAAAPEKPMAGMEGMDHEMTQAQYDELRQKIPPYKDYTNEQIMAGMMRMPPDWWGLISSKDMKGDIGVLALGHGYTLGGNEQFENYAGPISKVHPTTVAPGMAMMSSSHIQKAVDELTANHGVKTIVVIPMEPGDDSSLIGQWRYIFGLQDYAPYLTIPRVKTDAKIVFTKSPASDPHVSTILKDYAMGESAHPDKDRVIIISHGPETVEANPAELAVLQMHADAIRKSSPFKDVKVVSIQDDAIPPVRAAHVQEIKDLIKEANDQGRDAIIVPLILTKGGFHARLQKDLAGLNYKFANKGLIEHPAFQEWITSTVQDATASVAAN
jgi:hypothetical protein